MRSREFARIVTRACFAVAMSSCMLYSGGCSLRSIGAGLLSNFANGDSLGLSGIAGQLLGAAT
jgi:hypothetical protein